MVEFSAKFSGILVYFPDGPDSPLNYPVTGFLFDW
jgi:hypothetical protein